MKLAFVKLLVSVGAIALTVNLSSQAQSGNCIKVGGTMLTQFIDEKTGQYQLSGDLQGTGRGLILEQKQDKSTTTVKLEHTFVTSGGDLLQTKGDLGTFIGAKEQKAFASITFKIVGGTGRYNGANGTLESIGAADFASGQGVLRYNGSICTNR
jgi:hypothetical protein